MTDTITAWRYWRIDNDGFDFAAKRWDWVLRGDIETWDGPFKEAGSHRSSYLRLFLPYSRLGEQEPEHESPAAGCLCGVNALKRLRSLDLTERATPFRIRGTRHTVAFAQVDLGGRVDEYEEGYRARQALISGPIYVVNPPDGPGWREAIERRYGQPVIVQEYEEAIDWIRKDEEANGYRQAHQDARARAAGGPITAGGYSLPGALSYVPLTNSTSGVSVGALTSALIAKADDAKRTRERRRARARLIHRWALRVAFAMNIGLVAAYAAIESPLSVFNIAAAVVFGWMMWRESRSPGPVTWDELKKWAKAHGAKNDDIAEIAITQAGDGTFAVEMEGHERNAQGQKYTVGIGASQDVATWRSTGILRRLP